MGSLSEVETLLRNRFRFFAEIRDGVGVRWIKDIPTFKAEGHVWEDVRFVSCEHLRSIPDGPPIPPDAGTRARRLNLSKCPQTLPGD